MDTLIAERDAAMDSVEQAAQRRDPNFKERAINYILLYLRESPRGTAVSGELLVNECKSYGIAPHDDRAFGPVFMQMSRMGMIRKAGTTARLKGHLTSGANLWTLVQ